MQTRDLSDQFFIKVQEVAQAVGAEAAQLLGVMMSESGVHANAHNPNGHASGLIQFMPITLIGLGWHKGHAEFRRLDALEQLPFVEKYFSPYKGKLKSIAAIYTATFLPALVDHAGKPDYVLTAKDGQLGWAYGPNSVFDTNKDYKITVEELERAVTRNCQGPRWSEIEARLSGTGLVEFNHDDADNDLGTIYGLQESMSALGFELGEVDGVAGPKTRAAVSAFQQSVGLRADGIYGPLTRAALEKELGHAK